MLNLAISGITGRMGQACLGAAKDDETVKVVLGTMPKAANILAPEGIALYSDLAKATDPFDVLIDFTLPDSTLLHAKACSQLAKPMVIGTTGFSASQFQLLKEQCANIPVLYSSNMSIGVHVLAQALSIASKLLKNEDVTVDIIETHHRLKQDSPSGTALTLAATIEKQMQKAPNAPQSIRSGHIVGEHEVRFGLPFERITLAHEAFDRKIFAQGAIKAAKWLHHQPPGWYEFADIFA